MDKHPERYDLGENGMLSHEGGSWVAYDVYEDLQNSVNEMLEAASQLYAEKCEQLEVARQEVQKADNFARNVLHAIEHYRFPLPVCGHFESQALSKRRELFDYEVANPR